MIRGNLYLKLVLTCCTIAILSTLIIKLIKSDNGLLAQLVPSTYTDLINPDFQTTFDTNQLSIDTSFLNDFEVPRDNYLAFYFNLNNNVLFPTYVDHRSLVAYNNITNNIIKHNIDGHTSEINITPSSFVGFWIGKMDFNKSGNYNFYLSNKTGNSILKIDGNIIGQGSNSDEVYNAHITSGFHTVEIISQNTQSNFDIFFNYTLQKNPLNYESTNKLLKKELLQNMNIYYVSANNSSLKDYNVNISVSNNKKPIGIILDSYEPVNWSISNTTDSPIAAIIYNSAVGQSNVLARKKANIYNGKNLTFEDDTNKVIENKNLLSYTNLGALVSKIETEMEIPVNTKQINNTSDLIKLYEN